MSVSEVSFHLVKNNFCKVTNRGYSCSMCLFCFYLRLLYKLTQLIAQKKQTIKGNKGL